MSLFGLSRYQWFVFIVCCLAWDMDCMDQQLFVLGRRPAMQELVNRQEIDPAQIEQAIQKAAASGKNMTPEMAKSSLINGMVTSQSTWATSVFMVGWAIGGIAFGIMGDRYGRVRTLMLTILLYALFTGLSAAAQSTFQFHVFRLLTGLGVGGVFAAAVTLLAETLPTQSRPFMLGLFQASSVLGNCTAALLSIYLAKLNESGQLPSYLPPWRMMFLVGIIPGFLVVLVQLGLKEPESWKEMAGRDRQAGSYRKLLGDVRWRGRALGGLLLAVAGVVGLWAISFFIVDLQAAVSEPKYKEEAAQIATRDGLVGEAAEKASAKYVSSQKAYWGGITSLVQNAGSFFGIFTFSVITLYVGRKTTFAIFFVLAGISTGYVFMNLKEWSDIFWMVPLMGFFQLSLFGGFAIYLPELFPTSLRSTGTSFCYNVGRLVSAIGPYILGVLTSSVFFHLPAPDPLRYAGLTMCAVYLLGLVALLFLPETRGKPLPEE